MEILGELAFIYLNLGDLKRTCGTLFAIYNLLFNVYELTEHEFNEIYNKLSHSLGWYGRVIETGKCDLGETYHAVEAGFFTNSRPALRTYKHKHGNTNTGPATILSTIATNTGSHRIAWLLQKYIKKDNTLPESLFTQYHAIDSAGLAARFGTPTEAIEHGIVAYKLKAMYQQINKLENKLDALSFLDTETNWGKLPENEKKSFEAFLLYDVFTPMMIEVFVLRPPKNQIINLFEGYRNALNIQPGIKSSKGLLRLIDYLEQIALIYTGTSTPTIKMSDNETVNVLWALAQYEQLTYQTLPEKLQLQINATGYFWEKRKQIKVEHIMYGLGRMFHRYWSEIATTKRFLLSNPQLMEMELHSISPRQNEITVARTLQCAAKGVGVAIDSNAKELINNLLNKYPYRI
jgi:hypothetical protein